MTPLWWLSFADPASGTFLGLFITHADSPRAAIAKSRKLKANPGGQILIQPVNERIPKNLRDRLLSRKEAELIGESIL